MQMLQQQLQSLLLKLHSQQSLLLKRLRLLQMLQRMSLMWLLR
jgi:hypothetical protein